MSKGTAPLSSHKYVALMKRWGFVDEKRSGGHLIMKYGDRRVQIAAPGRHMPVTYKSLRKAASILDVDLPTFLAGPQSEVKAQAVTEIRSTQPCGCVVDEHGFEPCGEHNPKGEDPGMAEDVVAGTEDETPRTRRRLRRKGRHSSIAEVSWERTYKGQQAVRQFGVSKSDLDIEVPDADDEDENDDLLVVVSVTDTVEDSKTFVQTSEQVNTPKVQAERMLRLLFPEGLPQNNEDVEGAVVVWVAATAALLKTVEAAQ